MLLCGRRNLSSRLEFEFGIGIAIDRSWNLGS